jgi:hypothetical protein
LNGIAWIAKTEIPSKGVSPGEVSVSGLQENQDYPPRGWAPEQIESKLKEFNGKVPKKDALSTLAKPPSLTNPKALFASKVVTAQTPGQGVDVSVAIKGAKELHLFASDAGNGYACDWADWVNPRLVDISGKETKLTSMKWKHASSGWGEVNLNANAQGSSMKVAGKIRRRHWLSCKFSY